MSHTRNLEKAGLPTLRTLTRRILRVFDSATASDFEAGARWYDDARELAVSLSAHTGGDVERSAAVIAALSPRTPWARNVAAATALLAAGEVIPGVLGRNLATAQQARATGIAALGGPKTRRFAANISGDDHAVTVDVWAARVAGISEKALQRKGVYDAVERAYRKAAYARGVTPATMQATTWVIQRNGRAH